MPHFDDLQKMKFRFLVIIAFSATSAFGNSYAWRELVPPEPQSIVAFSNGKPPSTNFRIKKEKSEILHHLKTGVVFYNRQSIYKFLKEEDRPDIEIYDGNHNVCDGVIVTREGKVIFWNMLSPHVIRLETENTEGCYLVTLTPKKEIQTQ